MEEHKVSSTPSSPTTVVPLDNSLKLVHLALDYSKNAKELTKCFTFITEDDKYKSNFSYIQKTQKISKKLNSLIDKVLTKLMRHTNNHLPLSSVEMDKRRINSLHEFVLVIEKIKQCCVNVKEQEFNKVMVDEVNMLVQEGHLILSTIILNEIPLILSLIGSDTIAISRSHLQRILSDVKSYSDSVNTMKFPPEWEHLLQELSKKGQLQFVYKKYSVEHPITTITATTAAVVDYNDSTILSNSPVPKYISPPDESYSDKDENKDESFKEESEIDDKPPQIEIRGDTNGFVGAVVEFDIVIIPHEHGGKRGSIKSLHASDLIIEINGPALNSPITISPKAECKNVFRIEYTPMEAGTNVLSVFMHRMLLISGIKSIISKVGEPSFLISTKDLYKGQQQAVGVLSFPTSTHDKDQSRAEMLKQKIDDIASALQMLENLRTTTLQQIQHLYINEM